jgi:uncharacterized protein (DUF1330 family)
MGEAKDKAAASPDKGKSSKKAYILVGTWFKGKKGAQRYQEYLAAASPIAKKYGARRVESLLPVESLHGGFDPDYMYIVEWPSIKSYFDFISDMHYRNIAPLLSDAVDKQVILHCRRPE